MNWISEKRVKPHHYTRAHLSTGYQHFQNIWAPAIDRVFPSVWKNWYQFPKLTIEFLGKILIFSQKIIVRQKMHFADFQRFFIGHLWKRWHDTKKGPKLSMRTIFYHVTISFGLKSFEIGQPLHILQKLGSQSIFLNNRMGFQILTPEIFVFFLQSSVIRTSVFPPHCIFKI